MIRLVRRLLLLLVLLLLLLIVCIIVAIRHKGEQSISEIHRAIASRWLPEGIREHWAVEEERRWIECRGR